LSTSQNELISMIWHTSLYCRYWQHLFFLLFDTKKITKQFFMYIYFISLNKIMKYNCRQQLQTHI